MKSNLVAPTFATALIFLSSQVSHALDEPLSPPNVLLIMTDDQGFGDIRSHNNPDISTPVLDRLASDGARFERFFVSPVCAPTRASLLTGRYSLRTGVHGVTRAAETMRADEVTIAEIFKANGYTTGIFGKWHNGAHYPHHPNGKGFDEFIGFCAGHWNNYFDTTLEHNGRPIRTQGYITDVLTDYAIRFIHKNQSKPWFCYIPYNAPHSPWQVPRSFYRKYKKNGLDDKTACAYAMVENIDWNIGRIVDVLQRKNISRNTIVLFLTDNGPNSTRYNANMKGRKGSVHEGGVRVPFFIKWPGKIKPKSVIQPIAAHIDLLPTLVALTGVKPIKTKPLDGISFAPLLRGVTRNSKWPDRHIFSFRLGSNPFQGAVRTQKWRAVRYNKHIGWELYNMIEDPNQKKNVAKANPNIVKKLAKSYESQVEKVTSAGFAPIPTEVGHEARPTVELHGHEAHLQPTKGRGISYNGRSGWANDWITNWTDPKAYPQWPIKVVKSGKYKVTIRYICAEENTGAKLQVQVANQKLDTTIIRAHNPRPIHSPDLITRKEVYEKVWATQSIGTVELETVTTHVRIKALSLTGKRAPDIKSITLTKIK